MEEVTTFQQSNRLHLLTEWTRLECEPGKLNEVREKNGGKVILRGVLQRADVLNQNGRVYPRSILEREIRNYQKFIRENRAMGECVPPGTGILTESGWKNIEDISENEVIATYNPTTNCVEYQQITEKIVFPYAGKLHRIHNHSTYDMLVTPSHKLVLWNRKNEPYKMTSSAMLAIYYGNDEIARSELSQSMFKGEYTGDLGEIAHQTTMSADLQFMKIDEVDYDGMVYCVNVKNGSWLMRHNEHVAWTGNCDHPETSVVELKKVSHVVREAEMDPEGTVAGVVELLDTPCGKILQSLVESGITLGISSRGVGSTKRDGDSQVVQDDFQLICFDIVAEPSTTSAFLLPEGLSVARPRLDKTDRIYRIFNEIESWPERR